MELSEFRNKLPELSSEIMALQKLLKLYVGSSLNKIRVIAEKVCYKLCLRHEVEWGAKDPALGRMLGPLISNEIIPKNVSIHVKTLQNYASPGSHFQEDPLSTPHRDIALSALVQFLQWYYKEYSENVCSTRPSFFLMETKMTRNPFSSFLEIHPTKIGGALKTESIQLVLFARHRLLWE